MAEPLLVIDDSEIQDGRLAEVKSVIADLVEFVQANESRPLAYGVYLDEDGTHMTVVQIHPDSASMECHMKVAAPAFARFAGLIKLSRMDVYGDPSDELLELIRQKVRLLGPGDVKLHSRHAGFTRWESRGGAVEAGAGPMPVRPAAAAVRTATR